MTRAKAIETAEEYRNTARAATRDNFPLLSAYYYTLARKYLRRARDLRPARQLPNPELVQTT